MYVGQLNEIPRHGTDLQGQGYGV